MKAWLLLKNLIFTAVVPGFVVGWVPFQWFARYAQWPAHWAPRQWLAAIIFVLGAVVFLHCQWLFFSRGQGTPAPIDPPKKFVRRGLYKWVRNPMYLGVLAMVGSEALFLRSFDVLIYFICLTCAVHLFVVLYEENSLRFRFGAMYEDYKRDVSRWLPRRPRPLPQTVAPFEVAKGKERGAKNSTR
jgi:protein-S-isoprenylcysteine O-methyltransferase Ste14